MELCCIGSGLTSRLKNANKRSSTSQRESGLRTWVAGFWTLRVFSLTGGTNFSTFMVLIAKKGPALRDTCNRPSAGSRSCVANQPNVCKASGCDVASDYCEPPAKFGTYVALLLHCRERVLRRIVGSAMDVTEHEHLTQELQRREAYLTEAQKLSHTGSF